MSEVSGRHSHRISQCSQGGPPCVHDGYGFGVAAPLRAQVCLYHAREPNSGELAHVTRATGRNHGLDLPNGALQGAHPRRHSRYPADRIVFQAARPSMQTTGRVALIPEELSTGRIQKAIPAAASIYVFFHHFARTWSDEPADIPPQVIHYISLTSNTHVACPRRLALLARTSSYEQRTGTLPRLPEGLSLAGSGSSDMDPSPDQPSEEDVVAWARQLKNGEWSGRCRDADSRSDVTTVTTYRNRDEPAAALRSSARSS